MALIEKLSAIANAIRSKTGKTEGLTLEQMPGEIEGLETGGGVSEQEILDGMMAGTWPTGEIVFTEATRIADRRFEKCSGITKVTGKKVTYIGVSAFENCTNLAEIDFPELLETKNFCFRYSKIKHAYFPKLTKLDYSTFNGLNTLESFYGPLVASIGNSCFQETSITEINLPLVKSVDQNTFRYTPLVKADFGSLAEIKGSLPFGNNSKFQTLIIRTETMCALSTGSGFTSSPFTGLDGLVGYCYVPRTLISEYQQATNWSALYEAGTCIFRALEDYTIDGTTKGEMDWAKIEEEAT